MAGDWIKVRCDLQTHPKVVRILSAMRRHDVQTVTDKFRVIGGLHAVWTVFDQHSTDGTLPGYTPEVMDHIIGWDGFAQAMIDVGWLVFDEPETLVMPEFEEHNGKSGKRRAEDQKRKRKVRKSSDGVSEQRPNDSGQKADKKRTREEESREEIKDTEPNGSDAAASLAERVWGEGLETLARLSGRDQKALRSVVGKWRKDHGDQATFDAILRASKEAPSDPVAWITGSLKAKKNPARSEADYMLRDAT